MTIVEASLFVQRDNQPDIERITNAIRAAHFGDNSPSELEADVRDAG